MPFHTATAGMPPLPLPVSLSIIAMFCPLVLKLPSPQGLCFRLWGCLLLPSYDPRFDSLLRLLIFLWLC